MADNSILAPQTETSPELQAIEQDIKLKAQTPPVTGGGSDRMLINVPTDNNFFYKAPIASPQKISLESVNYNVDDAYAKLNDGTYVAKYDTYKSGANNNEIYAQSQGTGEKWLNGLAKFGGKTLNAVVGGTVGVVYGAGAGIADWSLDSVYDNNFSNWMGDLDTKMNYQLPNYYTQQETDKGLGGQLLTANFWADKVLGGLSFTAGAVVSEGIWAWATGGTSLATSAARWSTKGLGMARVAKGTSKFANLLKGSLSVAEEGVNVGRAVTFGKIGDAANTLRFTMTSAGYEASVEALQFKKEQQELFYQNFQKEYGREPEAQEVAEFEENLSSSANAVFGVNMALVGSSNLVTLGKIFNLKSPVKTGFSDLYNQTLYGIGKSAPSKLQSINRRVLPFVQNSITEGLYEEGGQSVTSATAGKWLQHAYSPQATKDSFDLAGALYENLSHQYGSKEGWVENGVGMIIGILGEAGTRNTSSGINQQVREFENRTKLAETYTPKALSEHLLMMNRVNNFNKESEDAQKKGNLTEARIAQDGVIFSMLNNRYQLGDDVKDVTLDIEKSLSTVTQEQLSELGIETDLGTWKQEQLSAFTEVAKSFKKNRQFAEYIIGRNPVAGIQELDQDNQLSTLGANNTQEALIQSLAYTMMGGQRSNTIMKEAVTEMSQILDYEKVKALDTISTLETVTQEKRSQLNIAINASRSLQEQRQNLVDQLRSVEETVEGDIQTGNKVLRISERLAKVDQVIAENEAQLQQLADEINLNSKTYEQTTGIELNLNSIVTTEDLKNLDENTKKLDQVLKTIGQSNPENSARLEAILEEFNNARKTFGAYQNTVLAFSNGKVKIDNINTLIGRKILKKGKTLNQSTKEWLSEILGNYSQEAVQGLNDIAQIGVRDAVISNESIVDKLRKNQELSEEELAFYNQNKQEIDTYIKREVTIPVQATPTAKTKLEYLRERLNNLISKSNNALTFIGTSTDEFLLKKPTQAEVEEYQRLLSGEGVNTPQKSEVNQSQINEIERRREEVQKIKKLKFSERIPELQKLGIITDVYQYGNRPIVIVNINGESLPFYRSSQGTSGKIKGQWFPMFGFGKSKSSGDELGWLIKPSIKDLENNLNSRAIEEYSDIINSTLNWEHSLDTQSLQNPFFKPFVTFKTNEEGFNEKVFGVRNLNVFNDGKTSYAHIDNIVNKINAEYDAEIESLNQSENTQTSAEGRLEELEQKLSQWKVLDSFVNEEGMTMADLAELIQQQEQNISEQETLTEITGDDSYAMTSESEAGATLNDYTLAQNTTGNATLHRNQDGTVTLHHISPQSLVDIIGENYSVTRKDRPIEISEIAIGDIVYTESGISFSLEAGNIIKMRSETFDRIPLLVVRSASSSWTYADLYYFNGSEYVKKPSDFSEDIQAQEIYNAEVGENVRFEIDRQDDYTRKFLEKYKKSPTAENRKALTDGIKIYLVSKGKRISTLKGERGASTDNFKLLREKAFELAIQDTYVNDLEVTTKVSAILLGSPQFFISEQGQLESRPFTESAIGKVLSTGYVLNGEIVTSEETPKVNTSYVSKVSRKYPQRKMPIVIVKRGLNYVALPIQLNKQPLGQRGRQMVEEAVNQSGSAIETAKNVNALINQEGVRTAKILPQEVSEEVLEKIKTDFENHLIFTTADELASEGYEKANLQFDAQMYVDIDNLEQAISSPKIRIDLVNMLFNQEVDFDSADIKTSVEDELNTTAQELYNDFIRNSAVTYVNSRGDIIENSYTDAFDDESMLPGESHLDKLHNIRILRKAFEVDFSKNKILRDAIGQDKIERVKILFNILDNIGKQITPNKSTLASGTKNTKC